MTMWSLKTQIHLPRSLFIGAGIRGADTSEVCALSDYVRRTARINGFTPGQFVWGAKMKQLAAEHDDVRAVVSFGTAAYDPTTLSTAPSGLRFAQALGRLTGERCVERLNWSAHTTGLNLWRMQRKREAWCPECLASDKDPYIRAKWQLCLYSVCPRHSCMLVDSCHSCGARQSCRGDARGGLNCHRCERPLAQAGPIISASLQEIEWARRLDQLVELVLKGEVTLERAVALKGLDAFARRSGASSVKKRAKLFGCPQSLMCYWSYTDREPSVERLLEICLHCGIAPTDLFSGAELSATQHCEEGQARRQRGWLLRRFSAADRELLVAKMRSAIETTPGISLAAVARAAGVHHRSLKALSPSLAADLSRLYKEHRSKSRDEKFRASCAIIDDYVRECAEREIHPTIRDLGMRFPLPGCLRDPKLARYARDQFHPAP